MVGFVYRSFWFNDGCFICWCMWQQLPYFVPSINILLSYFLDSDTTTNKKKKKKKKSKSRSDQWAYKSNAIFRSFVLMSINFVLQW